MNRKIILGIIGILLAVSMISFSRANILYCLGDGEQLPPGCFGSSCRYICELKSGEGYCQICTTNSGIPGVKPATCNGQVCSTLEGTVDESPPEITLGSPQENWVYSSRAVIFDISADEYSKLERWDVTRRRWVTLCTRCLSYNRKLSFAEGENQVLIRATDAKDNSIEKTVIFTIDSKKPKISKTMPKKGFTNGGFEAQISEENPVSLILNYGTFDDMRTADVNLDDCYEDRRKTYCDIDVDLSRYNGKEIDYWFKLTDIAGSVAESKPVSLNADTVAPDLKNDNSEACEENSFWCQGEGRYNKYIYFTFDVDEENFDEISYIDYSDGTRARWKKICSRLKEGKCVVKKTFRSGFHSVDIQIMDEAGNAVSTDRVEFNVV